MMEIVEDIAELRRRRLQWRGAGERIALVPTMGNLHPGHLRLIREARSVADRVVVSLFVNPMQFDRAEDLAAYPRTLDEDRRSLEGEGVDLLFCPRTQDLYARDMGQMSYVEVPGLSAMLCGAGRPGHFRGVATVVSKLFNLVQPELAVFGEKDYQQLILIRRLVEDLNFPVEVVGVPTVRESDGLAMSSRNGYLSEEERLRAPALYRVLEALATRIAAGHQELSGLERSAMAGLRAAGLTPEYVSIRRAEDLDLPAPGDHRLVILGAAWLGKARLIDNLQVER